MEVSTAGAQNIVAVRSDESVHNKCQVPLKVRLQNVHDPNDVIMDTVAPGITSFPLFNLSFIFLYQITPLLPSLIFFIFNTSPSLAVFDEDGFSIAFPSSLSLHSCSMCPFSALILIIL